MCKNAHNADKWKILMRCGDDVGMEKEISHEEYCGHR